MPPAFGVGVPCPTQAGWLGTRRPRLPVRPRPRQRLGPQEVFSSNLLSLDRHTPAPLLLRGTSLSLLPGLEKCCGLTPPFDDLARSLQRPLAAPPPLVGEYGRGLLAGARTNGRAQSFFVLSDHSPRESPQIKKAPQRERGARGHPGSGVVWKRKKVKSPQKLIIPPPRRQGK